MKMELLHNGCLKIVLSDTELVAMDLHLFSTQGIQQGTRAAIRKLVRLAGEEVGFPTNGNITIEAIPLEGGCLLLLSPTDTKTAKKPAKSTPPRIYRTNDFDALAALASALPHNLYTSLYAWKNSFYLCHYIFCSQEAHLDTVIREFLTPVRGEHSVVAMLDEHGKCLASGDAIAQLQLTAPGYHAPKQSDPPH